MPSERCIMWTPTPLTPVFSNNNVQLFQTPDYVVMYHEMIHDVRVIPLDGRPHLDEHIRLARATMTRLTFDESLDTAPFWTPDGSKVVFGSSRDGGGLFWKATDGTGEVERLLETPNSPRPYGWSADGRLVMKQLPGDIDVLTVEGDRTMELVLDTEFTETQPAISPDGRWMVYMSSESRRTEVYVRPFPDADAGR